MNKKQLAQASGYSLAQIYNLHPCLLEKGFVEDDGSYNDQAVEFLKKRKGTRYQKHRAQFAGRWAKEEEAEIRDAARKMGIPYSNLMTIASLAVVRRLKEFSVEEIEKLF
jgi:hypothetical protein